MTHNELIQAIFQLTPNAEFVLSGTDIDNLTWLDERPKPTMDQINAAIANPLPKPEPTIEEKLSGVGLSLADLKAALGI